MAERKLINGKKDLRVKDIDGVKHKYCPRCGTYKLMTVEFFSKNKNLSTGFDSYCKDCRKSLKNHYARYQEFNNKGELYCLKCKSYKSIDNFLDTPNCNIKRKNKDVYCESCRKETDDPLISHINKILYECKYTKEKYKKDYNVNLTTDEIISLYHAQNHKCALTGVELTFIKGGSSTNLSIDRINPGEDYVISNIRLVCNTINYMRSNMTDDEFLNWCKLVVDYNN